MFLKQFEMDICNSVYLINIQMLYKRHFCDLVAVTYCIVSTITAVRDSLFPSQYTSEICT
jgi:hypothetical protein